LSNQNEENKPKPNEENKPKPNEENKPKPKTAYVKSNRHNRKFHRR
jgi:hypothetical protein